MAFDEGTFKKLSDVIVTELQQLHPKMGELARELSDVYIAMKKGTKTQADYLAVLDKFPPANTLPPEVNKLMKNFIFSMTM